MLAFSILEGTKIKVLKEGKELKKENLEDKVTNKEAMYFREDIVLDCIGKLTQAECMTPYGIALMNLGYYGFKLPENKRGYTMLFVKHEDAITDMEEYNMRKHGREV